MDDPTLTGDNERAPAFIDLFAGCGGLSLGLLQGGWRGIFAIERDPMAFETYRYNLVDGPRGFKFEWPGWMPKQAHDVRSVLREFQAQIKELRGKVDLVVGGPPCQGFSFAGRRRSDDPRNRLFKDYLKFVAMVEPRLVLIENVKGMAVRHGKKHAPGRKNKPYTDKILGGLMALGYQVLEPVVLRASEFGVPQRRPRVFILAVRGSGRQLSSLPSLDQVVGELRAPFLRSKGLRFRGEPTSAWEAISDLEKVKQLTYVEPFKRVLMGFEHGKLGKARSDYQRLMRCGHRQGFAVDSHRFANHSPQIRARLGLLLDRAHRTARRGVQLSPADRAGIYMTAKHVIVAMCEATVAHTVTTLPDDLIHYKDARILTVRETARLQSFPDWFEFKGKYTTGGPERTKQAPRYTQVGNAVAPLVAEIVSHALRRYLGLESVAHAFVGEPRLERRSRLASGELPSGSLSPEASGLPTDDEARAPPEAKDAPASLVEPDVVTPPVGAAGQLPSGRAGVADAA